MQKETDKELRERLSELQYKVTQEGETEPPYTNQYNLTQTEGIYLCVICATPLFTSTMKDQSTTGWPSFHQEIQSAQIQKLTDKRFGLPKTEVKCSKCNSHLGHLFNADSSTKAKRYCINSASLKFQEEFK